MRGDEMTLPIVSRMYALFLLLAAASCVDETPQRRGIVFERGDVLSRSGYNYGDSWMMTWAADGTVYTNFSDGRFTDGGEKYSNALLIIEDDPPDLTAASIVPVSADPLRHASSWAYYIISTLAVGDTLYVGMIDFSRNGGIARSTDGGLTLDYDRSRPMWPSDGPKIFAYPSFLQDGQGYGGNRDGYVYVYATDGDWAGENALRLARVPADADLLDVGAYSYWDGSGFSPDLAQAADLLPRSSDLGGMQSILYNPVHGRYYLITFGDARGPEARMVLFAAPEPWGPWERLGAIPAADAVFNDEPLHSRVYNPSFNAKWIDPDGGMWISYSSCCRDEQYAFSYGRLTVND
jgi:hypothetical protein